MNNRSYSISPLPLAVVVVRQGEVKPFSLPTKISFASEKIDL
jgi:hypothetical protein